MDKTVPGPAARLLDLIGRVEAPRGYDTYYSNGTWQKPVTKMTVDELIETGPLRKNKFGSSAAGRYQFMATTLADLKRELRLNGSQVMTPDLQDRLGYHLLRRRAYDKWADHQISHDDFMIGICKEWASFPVPYAMKGSARNVERGQSYYAGDGLNKALIGATEVWKALEDIRRSGAVVVPEKPMDDKERQDNLDKIIAALLAQLVPAIQNAVSTAIKDSNVPLESPRPMAAAYEVSHRVVEEIAARPEIQHVTNTEPWYQSRVTVGNLVSAASALLAGYGVITTPDQQLAAVEIIGALGILLGNAFSLYGRWVAKKPIGT